VFQEKPSFFFFHNQAMLQPCEDLWTYQLQGEFV